MVHNPVQMTRMKLLLLKALRESKLALVSSLRVSAVGPEGNSTPLPLVNPPPFARASEIDTSRARK